MSKEKAFNLNTKKIDWAKVIYPNYTHNLELTKKQRDRKREIFRNRCNNYIIENNNLYKKDKHYEFNKVKYQIPLETEKYNLIIIKLISDSPIYFFYYNQNLVLVI